MYQPMVLVSGRNAGAQIKLRSLPLRHTEIIFVVGIHAALE